MLNHSCLPLSWNHDDHPSCIMSSSGATDSKLPATTLSILAQCASASQISWGHACDGQGGGDRQELWSLSLSLRSCSLSVWSRSLCPRSCCLGVWSLSQKAGEGAGILGSRLQGYSSQSLMPHKMKTPRCTWPDG